MGIWVRYYALPAGVDSFVAKSCDDYTIVINKNISYEAQQDAYIHETAHIRHGDLDRELTADEIEAIRHRKEG